MKKNTLPAVFCALLAALFYALNTPLSKYLLNDISPTYLASFLYLGAGFGVGILYLFHYKKEDSSKHLSKKRFTLHHWNDCIRYYCANLNDDGNQYWKFFQCVLVE